jgi:hypothetical protein
MAYQPTRIDWLLNQLGADITPNADVIDNAPLLVGTVVVNGITYYKYSLPGKYVFNSADTFYLKIKGYAPLIPRSLSMYLHVACAVGYDVCRKPRSTRLPFVRGREGLSPNRTLGSVCATRDQ